LHRNIDRGAWFRCQNGVHAGTGGGEASDEGGLFPHRTDRRFRQVVHLAGQQARDAAGIEQGQIGRRIVGIGAGRAERRDRHQRRDRVTGADRCRVRPVLTEDQIGARQRLGGDDVLPRVQVRRQWRGQIGIDAQHGRAQIGEHAAADGGREAGAELHDGQVRQQWRHVSVSSAATMADKRPLRQIPGGAMG
jgi:hypothetical protein